jgi:hypothetical protein
MAKADAQMEIHEVQAVKNVHGCSIVMRGKVLDDRLWDQIKAGGVTGFSISSTGIRAPIGWWRRFRLWLGGLFIALGKKIQGL